MKISVSIAPFVAAAVLVGCASDVRFSDLIDQSAAAEGTGIQGSKLIQIVILATHQASTKQRAVAEQNARRAVAKMQAQIAAQEEAPAPVKPAGGKKPTAATKPRKKLPRVIAVATERDAKTDPKAARAVMLWDTSAQQIVGNKVYDIESEPPRGADVRFETQAASYLGASL
ncbi:MAG TPA: hypothetical protein VFD27_06695 [Chthoniobacteraceae bacterium]|nr:hypothetical protein [Chthoniobacteraceae bacterium]